MFLGVFGKRNNKSELKVVTKNFSSLLVLQALSFILPLVTMPYLVRVLGSDRFGLVMFAQAFAVFFNVIVDLVVYLSVAERGHEW